MIFPFEHPFFIKFSTVSSLILKHKDYSFIFSVHSCLCIMHAMHRGFDTSWSARLICQRKHKTPTCLLSCSTASQYRLVHCSHMQFLLSLPPARCLFHWSFSVHILLRLRVVFFTYMCSVLATCLLDLVSMARLLGPITKKS